MLGLIDFLSYFYFSFYEDFVWCFEYEIGFIINGEFGYGLSFYWDNLKM